MSTLHQSQPDAHATAVRVLCPHCNGAIDLSSIVSPQPSTNIEQSNIEHQSPLPTFSGMLRSNIVRHLFPVSGAFEAVSSAKTVSDKAAVLAALRRHWKLFVAFVAGVVMISLGLMLWGRPIATDSAQATTLTRTAQPRQTTTSATDDAAKAAILDTLTRYNRAETEAAALLTMTPLQPLLLPNGPLAQRRAAQLAERQQRSAAHRTMLVRWAIGELSITNAAATVVTQETWSNQEKNAVAPEQATVRVTYTLRQDNATQRWLIEDSRQEML